MLAFCWCFLDNPICIRMKHFAGPYKFFQSSNIFFQWYFHVWPRVLLHLSPCLHMQERIFLILALNWHWHCGAEMVSGAKDLGERKDAQQPAKQHRNDASSVGRCWSGQVGQVKAEMGEWMDVGGGSQEISKETGRAGQGSHGRRDNEIRGSESSAANQLGGSVWDKVRGGQCALAGEAVMPCRGAAAAGKWPLKQAQRSWAQLLNYLSKLIT